MGGPSSRRRKKDGAEKDIDMISAFPVEYLPKRPGGMGAFLSSILKRTELFMT
jgi:hypothetical protein